MSDKFKTRYPGDTRAAIATDSQVLDLVIKIDQLQRKIDFMNRIIAEKNQQIVILKEEIWKSKSTTES